MRKLLLVLLFLCIGYGTNAQELQAMVTVNSQQVGGSNQQPFQTLQRSLRDFINNTSWTGRRLQPFEKIKCAFSLIISEKNGNSYKGNLVVQSTRPVYNSTYESPILNINDQNFSFDYIENEPLIFNERQFSGKNLIDVVSFYVYLILGYDADTYTLNGGTPWYQMAQRIAQNATGQQNYNGWTSTEGPRTRGTLIDQIINDSNNTLRTILYRYHRLGLDQMAQNPAKAKQEIFTQLMTLNNYQNGFQLNYPFSLFMDAKKNEIFNLFNSGNNGSINLNDLKNLLNTMDPKDSDALWNKWK